MWQWKDSPLSRVHHLPLPYVSWWCTNTPQWHCWIQNGHDNECVDLSRTNDICPKRKTIYIITCLYAAVTIVSWPHSLSLWIIVGLRSPLRQLSPFSSSSPLHGSFALSLLIPSSSADNTTSVSTLTDWESQQRCLCRRRFFLRVAAASQQLSEETRSFSAALRSAIKPANCCLLSDRHPLRPIVLLEYAVNTAAIYPADWQFLPPRAPKIIITYSTWPVQYILYISRLRDRWAAPRGGHRGRCFYQNSNSVHALNYNHATDKAWNPTEVDFYIFIIIIARLFLPAKAVDLQLRVSVCFLPPRNFAISHVFHTDKSVSKTNSSRIHGAYRSEQFSFWLWNTIFSSGRCGDCSPSQRLAFWPDAIEHGHSECDRLRVQSPTRAHSRAWNNGRRIKSVQLITLKEDLHFSRSSQHGVNVRQASYSNHVSVWNVSSNGHWNDKFHKAKKPMVIIHLLRSVKYTLKRLKLTAPRDKNQEWMSRISTQTAERYISTQPPSRLGYK